MEDDKDLESLISYLDDVREGDWRKRIVEMRPWSQLNSSYNLSM